MMHTSTWTISTPEEGRQILTKVFPVVSIGDAYQHIGTILDIVTRYEVEADTTFSFTAKDMLVVLHSFSPGELSQSDHDIATEIDEAILA